MPGLPERICYATLVVDEPRGGIWLLGGRDCDLKVPSLQERRPNFRSHNSKRPILNGRLIYFNSVLSVVINLENTKVFEESFV